MDAIIFIQARIKIQTARNMAEDVSAVRNLTGAREE